MPLTNARQAGGLTAEELKALSHPNLYRWLGWVAVEWSLIGGAIALAVLTPELWIRIVLGAFIGTRIHALGILAHEGVHWNVSASKSFNDAIANYLTAYPLMMTVQGYRSNHLDHHWRLETPDDPSRLSLDAHPADWTFPMRRRRVFWILFRDLIGLSQASSISLLRYLWNIPDRRPHIARLVIMHAVAASLAFGTGHGWIYWGLWLIPLFTVAPMCYRIRGVAEHSAVATAEMRFRRAEPDVVTTTRTTRANPLLAALIAPYHVSLHIEHHLHPSIPFFRLPRLHARLMADPAFASRAHVTRGYRALFRELTRNDVSRPEARIDGPDDGT